MEGRDEIASYRVCSVCLLKTRAHEESLRGRDVGKSVVESKVLGLPKDVEELLVKELSHAGMGVRVLK